MINESYLLSRSLKLAEISASSSAREYRPIPNASPKKPCIRIYIQDNGCIKDFETFAPEQVKYLRKFGDNQATFPAFNITALYRVIGKKSLLEIDRLRTSNCSVDTERIKQLCDKDNWSDNVVAKTNRCMQIKAKELSAIIEMYGEGRGESMLRLAEFAQMFGQGDYPSFRDALETCALDKLRRGDDVSTVLSVLFYAGKEGANAPDIDTGTLSIILDLADWDVFKYPIAGEETTKEVNNILLSYERASLGADIESGRRDAFGSPYTPINEPMPKIKLPGFDVALRTMFSGHPCQMRYRTIEGESYPLSYENRQSFSSALSWLADDCRRDITWTRADKDELVFAYPSKLCSRIPGYVKILGPVARREINKELFEKKAADFLHSFQGLPPKEKPEYIQVFSIRKIDKARAKVVFSRNYDAEQYAQAGREWEVACKNIPCMGADELEVPFPLEVAGIINNVWRQDGELAGRGKPLVKRMKYYEGIELMLGAQSEKITAFYLGVALLNALNLAQYIGKERFNTKKSNVFFDRLESVKSVACVLGMLLYKIGRRKEIYMEDTAYLLGQLLKVSDELHALYGEIVRKNDVPPQLAGNSFYLMASEMPVRALSQLGVRMCPYITWAKHYCTKGEEKSGLAGWYMGLFRDIADQLSLTLSGATRFGDKEKAELFLGYLASFPRKETNEAKKNDVQKNNRKEEKVDG